MSIKITKTPVVSAWSFHVAGMNVPLMVKLSKPVEGFVFMLSFVALVTSYIWSKSESA
ncbi:hypothetical protein HY490_04985, partial [Candidatus Woesearchaeota archaeon]|nr:hypothetical protein [Candidatus Woesearchaeota archaeon]